MGTGDLETVRNAGTPLPQVPERTREKCWRALRDSKPTTYVQDESAFLPDGEQSLAAVMPTGARIIAISSANSGWFGDQVSL